jgi:hypothetical protein
MVRRWSPRRTVTATRSPGSRSRTASVASPGASTRVADADDDVAGAQAGVVDGRVGHHLTDRRAAARGALRGRHAWRTRPEGARRIASVCATFVALTDAELPRAGRPLGDGAPRGDRALRDRPRGLVIEVTERFGGRMAPVVKSLRRPRAASLKLATDDVGAGNSGLAVEPFERTQAWALGEPPETHPVV